MPDSLPMARIPDSIRQDFPVLSRIINRHPLAYLDNAATTQKPQSVIEAITRFYETSNANSHRGVYALSEEASELYEQARGRVAQFLNAPDTHQIIFTRGTTEAINLVAYSWGRSRLQPGDRLLLTEMEHHSNLVPWQLVAEATGAELEYVAVTAEGPLDLDSLASQLAKSPKLLAVTLVSNVLGTINPLRKIITTAHDHGVLVLVDAAQAVGRVAVDVQELDCDFLAFSGHKVYGPTGIGALYAKSEHLDAMEPWQGGGGMIAKVGRDRSTWGEAPAKFEAGTPPIAAAIGLHTALDFVERLGVAQIREHERDLAELALGRLLEEPEVTVFGPRNPAERTGLVSFALAGVHPHDVAQVLDESGIAVRAGHHCAQVLHERLGVDATVRVSVGVYNTASEVHRAVDVLAEVRRLFL
ncbi:MAG: cysteine desulfurase [SAR324 cluster bacterium]|nr:cysteine desulfurase [SAR324 cluster bacterium]